jgi:hypothetical protein
VQLLRDGLILILDLLVDLHWLVLGVIWFYHIVVEALVIDQAVKEACRLQAAFVLATEAELSSR